MDFNIAVRLCLLSFEAWYRLEYEGLENPKFQHDVLEHGVVLATTGLMVVPGETYNTERAELCTLKVSDAFFEGKATFQFEGVEYLIPKEAISLFKKLDSFGFLVKEMSTWQALKYLEKNSWEKLEEADLQAALDTL